jgi:hypothetical protein
MPFMVMHKNDPRSEAGQPPPMELVQKMGALIGEYASTGRFIDGAGLGASRTRTRVTCRAGQCTVTPGPYAGDRELPANFLLLKVRTREEGLAWAERYAKILGDADLEVGKVNEPWDIGLMPAPENPPLQLLVIEKASAATEDAGHAAATKASIDALKKEMADAGVLQRTIALKPSRSAKRLHFVDHKMTVVDGPFTESKELIGGFAVMELADMDEAIAMTTRYAEILGGTLEVDIREVDAR